MRFAATKCVVGMVTCSSKTEARKLARAVLEPKLAACVNIVAGVESHYWWQGKLERGAECLLLVKTTEAKAAAVTRAVKAAHSYEVPEIIFVKVERGESRYLKWLRGSVAALLLLCAMPVSADQVDDALGRLGSGDEQVRAEAADQLAQFGGERAVKKFREMIASTNPEARQMAVSGLLRVSDAEEDVRRVGDRLKDESATVRWTTALALGRSGRREAAAWLEETAKTDASESVREIASESVAKLRSQVFWWRAVEPALKEARKSGKPVLVYFFVSESALCQRFETDVLASAEMVSAAGEFVCVRVDAGRSADEARRFDVRGAPTVVMCDARGTELARSAGAVEKERLLARMAEARRGTDTFREWQRRAKRNPSDAEANWRVARVYLDEGREDLAEPFLRNVIGYDERNESGHTGEALLAMSVLCAHRGQHAQAAYCCEQLLARWPKLAQADKALYCLALSRLAMGEREKARAALERLTVEFSESKIVPQAKQLLEKLGGK